MWRWRILNVGERVSLVTFDTSALNRLADQFSGGELAAALKARGLDPVLHVPAVLEICKTPDRHRRARLIQFVEDLRHAGGWKLLDFPETVAHTQLVAWSSAQASANFCPPDDFPLYRILAHPELLREKDVSFLTDLCAQVDARFLSIHGNESDFRRRTRALTNSLQRPRRIGMLRFLRSVANSDLGLFLGDSWLDVLGCRLKSEEVRALLLLVPTQLCYVAIHLEALHRHGFRLEGHGIGRGVPKWMDLSQFIYLGIVDALVTDDGRQRRRMRRLCRALFQKKQVWSSEELLHAAPFCGEAAKP